MNKLYVMLRDTVSLPKVRAFEHTSVSLIRFLTKSNWNDVTKTRESKLHLEEKLKYLNSIESELDCYYHFPILVNEINLTWCDRTATEFNKVHTFHLF